MIAGALEIICGVDAGVVNPLLLPAAQGEEKYAYIVITYDDFPGVFDILFVKGNRVSEYASLHHEVRAILGVQSVQMLLTACGKRCRVYLFSVPRQEFERFLRTFYFEPTLNIVIDRLSRKQITGLLTDSGCRNGILEVDSSGVPLPKIELTRFYSTEELLREATRFRRGRLSLYDLELNSAIRQRMAMLQGGVPGSHMDPESHADLDEPEPPRDVPGKAGENEEDRPPDPRAGTAPGIDKSAVPSPATGESELVHLFRDVLGKFTEAVREEKGTSLDRRINKLLCREFNCPQGFDPGLLDDMNAAHVLTVIEKVAGRGWSAGRKRLRKRAREIVRTLYETHNEVLQRHGLDTEAHECFRALRT